MGFDFPHQAAIRGHFTVDSDSFGSVFFIENPDFGRVPGLGFDYPHLAAISRNIQFNPAFEHEHDRFGVNGGSFVPVFWSDVSDYSDFTNSTDAQQVQQGDQQQGRPQPQIIVIQQPALVGSEQTNGRNPQAGSDSQAHSTAAPDTSAPAPDMYGFIFMRRDGTILFASGFFISEHILQYVTPEGIRRTVPLAELDTEATQKMNEARGTAVDLHK